MGIDQDRRWRGPKAGVPKRGHLLAYIDTVIKMLLGLKEVRGRSLCVLQGFAGSIRQVFANLPLPHYSTVSRRALDLDVVLPSLRADEPMHLVVDSTGLEVFGEGRWKIRKAGYSKRRWRKGLLAMGTNTGQVCTALLTHQAVGDGDVLSDLPEQIPADRPTDSIGGDGAYDSKPCRAAIGARRARPSLPFRDGAKPWAERRPRTAWRGDVIDALDKSNRREWKASSGYHRRSQAEKLMGRLNALTGNPLGRESVCRPPRPPFVWPCSTAWWRMLRPQSVRVG